MAAGVSLEDVIAAGLRGAELGNAFGRRWFGCSVAFKIEQALDIAKSKAGRRAKLRRIFDEVGATLNVPETVGAAFGILAMAEGEPKATAILAANLSGDADTIGAIACAMAGAFAGFDAIPAEDVAVLEADEVFQSYNVGGLAAGLQRMIEARLRLTSYWAVGIAKPIRDLVETRASSPRSLMKTELSVAGVSAKVTSLQLALQLGARNRATALRQRSGGMSGRQSEQGETLVASLHFEQASKRCAKRLMAEAPGQQSAIVVHRSCVLDARLPLQANEHQTAGALQFEAGGACTTIMAARKMGLDVVALGTLGDDMQGRMLLDMLEQADVDVAALINPDRRHDDDRPRSD